MLAQQEEWNDLQYSCSIENLDQVKEVIKQGIDANQTTTSRVLPQVTPLHIACKLGNLDLVKLILPSANINKADQYGFTPLHYATVARRREVVLYLLSEGASAAAVSKSGNTAKDLAEALEFTDILDALTSKINLENDPTTPLFRSWLTSLGGGEYTSKFIDAGYDLAFIAKHGVTDEDLNCIGVPVSKMGLRRKIMKLHDLEKFYTPEEEGEEEDEEEEEDENEEDDEEEEDEGEEEEED